MKKFILLFFLLSALSYSCKTPTSALIENHFKIQNFSSGSGMAKVKNTYYACGDDDAKLWFLNQNGEVLNSWKIWDTTDIQNNRINKNTKPDFEAISKITIQNDTALLVFGSGTKPFFREFIIEVHLSAHSFAYRKNATKLYEWIKNEAGLKKDELNIEGACTFEDDILILNRHNNQIYQINQAGLLHYLTYNDVSKLIMRKNHFKLPVIGKDTARLSSATRIPNTNLICFSASIEKTDQWINDGEILGSFIGLINWENKEYFSTKVKLKNNIQFKGKLEAIEYKNLKNNTLNIIGLTDDDDGTTSFLSIRLVNIPEKWLLK